MNLLYVETIEIIDENKHELIDKIEFPYYRTIDSNAIIEQYVPKNYAHWETIYVPAEGKYKIFLRK